MTALVVGVIVVVGGFLLAVVLKTVFYEIPYRRRMGRWS